MLGNYFLNRRYCTSNLIIVWLQKSSEATTDAEVVLADLEMYILRKIKVRIPPQLQMKGPGTEKNLFFWAYLRHKLIWG